MLSLVKSVLKSVELYLTLKNKLFFFELTSNHEKQRKKIKEEIAKGPTLRKRIKRNPLVQTASFFSNPLGFIGRKILDERKAKQVKLNPLSLLNKKRLNSNQEMAKSPSKEKNLMKTRKLNLIRKLENNVSLNTENHLDNSNQTASRLSRNLLNLKDHLQSHIVPLEFVN